MRSSAGAAAISVVLVLAAAGACPHASSGALVRVGGSGCAAAVRLPPRPLRVGVLLGANPNPGNPFELIKYNGLRRAVRELGVEGEAVVRGPRENGLASLSYLARKGFDVLAASGLLEGEALDAAAVRFPHVCFLSLDGPPSMFPHRPSNLRGTLYRSEQGAYLAGYLAVLMEEQQPGKPVVSSVGGVRAPVVDRFIAGFEAGARRADPSVTTLRDYSNDFGDTAKCRAVALHQIAAGSRVVFDVAGTCGLGALEAAKERHVFAVGVDADASSLGPYVLTSVLKNMDVVLVREVRSVLRGTFHGGTTAVLTLRNGGVGLGRISPRVPSALVRRIERVRRQIVAGRIRIPATLGRS